MGVGKVPLLEDEGTGGLGEAVRHTDLRIASGTGRVKVEKEEVKRVCSEYIQKEKESEAGRWTEAAFEAQA